MSDVCYYYALHSSRNLAKCGAMEQRNGRHKNVERMRLGELGPQMEKSQHSGSSACLLYIVELGGMVITYRKTRRQSYYIQLNTKDRFR